MSDEQLNRLRLAMRGEDLSAFRSNTKSKLKDAVYSFHDKLMREEIKVPLPLGLGSYTLKDSDKKEIVAELLRRIDSWSEEEAAQQVAEFEKIFAHQGE